MKKTLLIIFLIGLLIVAGLVVFVFTFDLNRYRPQIEKQATAALGHTVKIGNLSLTWRGGLAVEVDGVQVLSNDEPVLKVQRAGAVLEIAPLLRRSIQIGSLFLDGADVRVSKNSDGKIEIQGIHPPVSSVSENSSSETVSSASSGISPAWTSFLIGNLKLKDIHVHYEDDAPDFPVQLDLRNLDLEVKNVSLFRPMEFQASAALFNAKPNVHLSGRLKIEGQGSKIIFENFKAETNLGNIDLNELARGLPRAMAQNPISTMDGKLKADVEQLSFKNGKLDTFQADINLVDGQISALGASPLLDRLQISVSRFQLNSPVDFKIQGAVFSKESNLSLKGRLELGEKGRVVVGPAQADFDLDRLDWNRVESFLPGVREVGLASPPEGRVHAEIKRLEIQPAREPSGEIDFRYDQGRLRLKALPQDLTGIQLTGTLRGNQLNLDAWNINFGTSPVEARLNIQNIFSAPIFRSELRARNLDLKNLIPPAPAGQPQIEGVLSAELSFAGSGKVAEMILPSLTGSGHFHIENPVIRNFNALDQIFTKLSAIPGMSDAVNQRASDQLKDRLARRDTNLQTIDQEFYLQNQTLRFEKFETISPDLIVRGPVNIRLDGVIEARPTVWIHEEIMTELADRVHELAFALNSKGQLQIPLNVSGKAPQITIFPDVQFLLGEIVRNRSSQVVGQLAQRVASGKGPGKVSQILGITPYGNATVPSETSSVPEELPVEDNSVPVKVHSSGQQRTTSLLDALTGTSSQNGGQPVNRKAEIAAGLLNSLLSGNGNSSDSSNESESSQNFR